MWQHKSGDKVVKYEDLTGYSIIHMDKTAGSILREQRVTQRMTQAQVAEKAKITLQQYQKFENGSRNIRTASFQLACRVLKALNMDIERQLGIIVSRVAAEVLEIRVLLYLQRDLLVRVAILCLNDAGSQRQAQRLCHVTLAVGE